MKTSSQCLIAVMFTIAATTAGAQQTASAAPPAAADSTRPKAVPFAFADFTWLNGNTRQNSSLLDTKYFTGEFRLDANYVYDFNRPKDHTIVGSSEIGRANELVVQQLGVGGDFHFEHVRGRLMTQIGLYSTMTPRNDPSPSRGQWNIDNSYRYISEAYGGYHWDKWNGINLDAGIFMSYVGLFSYYNFDNWAYQPSYVSSNTPWYFTGLRLQTFLSDKLKLEYWLVNGWQSYAMINDVPGVGMQVLYRPTGALSVLSNNYYGHDTPNNAARARFHTDNSLQVKYYDDSTKTLSKAAISITADAGCESGGGVRCVSDQAGAPAQYFLGWMVYNRLWFHHDKIGVTLGGGSITNPGRYLVLVPPINGATAATGTPYFTANPGDPYNAWDLSATLDLMPDQWTTFRFEYNYRAANVPYFAGPGGVTPDGGNSGVSGSAVPGFTPDLRKNETRLTFALLIKL